jgi:hypothetical protein
MTAPAAALGQRAFRHLRRVGEGLNSDDRARLCDLTLQPYHEARFAR